MAIETKDININKVYMTLPNCKSRYLLLVGGAGSGKSHYAAHHFIRASMLRKNELLYFARKHFSNVYNSQYRMLEKNMIMPNDYVSTKVPLAFKNKYTKTELIARGCDDPEKIKSITDPTMFWLEELTEFTETEFNIFDDRLRKQGTDLQIIGTFNGVDVGHWIYKRFFKDHIKNIEIGVPYTYTNTIDIDGNNIDIDTTILQTNYTHNNFLDPVAKAVYESYKDIDINHYNVYTLGLWGSGTQGFIFKPEHYTEYESTPNDLRGILYCDPNLSLKGKGDKTAIIKIGYSANEQKLYILDFVLKSFSESNELLNTLLKMQDDQCRLIGFDGNFAQESTWTQHVQNYCSINKFMYPIIHYKRYKVDELAKNAQIWWSNQRVLFPKGFKKTETGENVLHQLYTFINKKMNKADDAPDALICSLEMLTENQMITQNNIDILKQFLR